MNTLYIQQPYLVPVCSIVGFHAKGSIILLDNKNESIITATLDNSGTVNRNSPNQILS